MKSTILLIAFLVMFTLADDYITDCSSLRVGTKKGATDVMLDGETTDHYQKFRRMRDEDDVEVSADKDEAVYYISGINLENNLQVSTHVEAERLFSATAEVTSEGDKKDQFKVKVNFDCTDGLAGVTVAHLTFTLDGNICDSNVVGIRKKCGNKYSYAPLEISETSYWGLKKNILTDNGGATNHPENLFDEEHESVVVKKSAKSLHFRVKNMAGINSQDSQSIDMDPPIVRITNQAEQVVYPVLRGAGARKHSLSPEEYTDFQLDFNCISLDTATETVEVVFRPSFHSQYIFKVTKECEGLTVSGLIKKEFQDSVVFDFFAFVFISSVIMAVFLLGIALYVKYRELNGEDVSMNKVIKNMNEKIKEFVSGSQTRYESGFSPDKGTQLEMDDVEDNITHDSEFNPDEVLKTNQKPIHNDEDDFKSEVQVKFDKDDENYPAHELKDINEEKPSAYGTL